MLSAKIQQSTASGDDDDDAGRGMTVALAICPTPAKPPMIAAGSGTSVKAYWLWTEERKPAGRGQSDSGVKPWGKAVKGTKSSEGRAEQQ